MNNDNANIEVLQNLAARIIKCNTGEDIEELRATFKDFKTYSQETVKLLPKEEKVRLWRLIEPEQKVFHPEHGNAIAKPTSGEIPQVEHTQLSGEFPQSDILTNKEVKQVNIDLIDLSGSTQSRVESNQDKVDEYAEAMQNGDNFPPVDLYFDGQRYWVGDGFHRIYACKSIGQTTVAAMVYQGTVRDALLHSVGANATHGLQRTNEDKRKAVLTLLNDEEWSKWSDRKIADKTGVTHKTVSKYRSELSGEFPQTERKVTRNGTTYNVKVTNISRSNQQRKQAALASVIKQIKQTVANVNDTPKEDLNITELKNLEEELKVALSTLSKITREEEQASSKNTPMPDF